MFAELVRRVGLSEDMETESRELIAGRIELFHEVIARGLASIMKGKFDQETINGWERPAPPRFDGDDEGERILAPIEQKCEKIARILARN